MLKMEHEDIIHGCMVIPEDIVTIIQTPQFQRLKGIKQLGIIFLTMPQVTTSRYDHCIGTYYLANKMLSSLEKNTDGLNIPEFYKKAVIISALLHDVGHGPFSHTWEHVCCGQYHHEENSEACIDEIFKVFHSDWMTDKQYALQLIKSLIVGDPSCLRDQRYRFLFDIVNNKQCNVDVDKWDYLKRDYLHIKNTLSFEVNTNFENVFLEARASHDRSHIEYRYCDIHKIYDIFNTRSNFHIHFYARPLWRCLENILKYIISESENDLEKIDGIKIREIRSNNTGSFLKLNDNEVLRIINNLKSSDEIIIRLIKCLENGNITEIYPKSDEAKLAVPSYLKVKVRIAYAGEEMHEDRIYFYGNKAEKPKFDQAKGYYESISYFQIN